MVDVILDTQDVRVLGGPATVNLELDFGKPGARGSYIYAGNGKPSIETLPTSFQVNDLYINLDESDDEYSYLYQYTTTVVDENPQNSWVPLLQLVSSEYFGTASQRNVSEAGDASNDEVVLGSDTRLSNQRIPENNSVDTTKIVDGSVTNVKLANDSVTINGYEIALGSETTIDIPGEIPNNSITNGQLQNSVIIINDQAVALGESVIIDSGTGVIADGSITNAKLQNSSITINGQEIALGDTTTLESGVPLVNGSVTTASPLEGVVRNIYMSNSIPTGGMDGDIWMIY